MLYVCIFEVVYQFKRRTDFESLQESNVVKPRKLHYYFRKLEWSLVESSLCSVEKFFLILKQSVRSFLVRSSPLSVISTAIWFISKLFVDLPALRNFYEIHGETSVKLDNWYPLLFEIRMQSEKWPVLLLAKPGLTTFGFDCFC